MQSFKLALKAERGKTRLSSGDGMMCQNWRKQALMGSLSLLHQVLAELHDT